MTTFLIIAGDPSGDLIASKLVTSLKNCDPHVHVTGIGGDKLEAVCDSFLANIVHQHAIGFAISPRQIHFFRNLLKKVIGPFINKNLPDVVIPVDFYGFNCHVAKMAKRAGRQVFYYVNPQFWASRSYRADRLRPYVDMFLCLFPFEEEFFKSKKLPAKFVGHPILDSLPDAILPNGQNEKVEGLVGLLPGSRPEEIRRHLPVIVEACIQINQQKPGTRFILFTVPHISKDFYLRLINRSKNKKVLIELVQDEHYLWRSQLDAAITASGMETLENTLLGIPMVVMYKTNWITYWIARSIINIPFVGMPNLLAKKEIVPELIQWKATPNSLAKPILNWLNNISERKQLRSDLLKLRDLFGAHGASQRAAEAILAGAGK